MGVFVGKRPGAPGVCVPVGGVWMHPATNKMIIRDSDRMVLFISTPKQYSVINAAQSVPKTVINGLYFIKSQFDPYI